MDEKWQPIARVMNHILMTLHILRPWHNLLKRPMQRRKTNQRFSSVRTRRSKTLSDAGTLPLPMSKNDTTSERTFGMGRHGHRDNIPIQVWARRVVKAIYREEVARLAEEDGKNGLLLLHLRFQQTALRHWKRLTKKLKKALRKQAEKNSPIFHA